VCRIFFPRWASDRPVAGKERFRVEKATVEPRDLFGADPAANLHRSKQIAREGLKFFWRRGRMFKHSLEHFVGQYEVCSYFSRLFTGAKTRVKIFHIESQIKNLTS
jgi:hypothetical protein